MKQNLFVGWALVVSMILFVVAVAFGYNTQFQSALYTLVGFGWIVFGIWAAVILLTKKLK